MEREVPPAVEAFINAEKMMPQPFNEILVSITESAYERVMGGK